MGHPALARFAKNAVFQLAGPSVKPVFSPKCHWVTLGTGPVKGQQRTTGGWGWGFFFDFFPIFFPGRGVEGRVGGGSAQITATSAQWSAYFLHGRHFFFDLGKITCST